MGVSKSKWRGSPYGSPFTISWQSMSLMGLVPIARTGMLTSAMAEGSLMMSMNDPPTAALAGRLPPLTATCNASM